MAKTLKHAAQKAQHRERSAPANRARLGLLEKHKDYVLRARDFHSKEDRLKRLREKAAVRNEDEFYMGMIKSKTKKGVHIQDRDTSGALDMDLVKVLKGQDAGYIRMQKTMEETRVRKLEEQLACIIAEEQGPVASGSGMDLDFDDESGWSDEEPVAPKRKHTVFTEELNDLINPPVKAVTSSKQQKQKSKGKGTAGPSAPAPVAFTAEEKSAHLSTLRAELSARRIRLNSLALAERELEVQRHLMGSKGALRILPKKGAAGTREGIDEEREGMESEPEKGLSTGARTFKWKAIRKR